MGGIRIAPRDENGGPDGWNVEIAVRARRGKRADILTALSVEELLEGIRAVASGEPWRPFDEEHGLPETVLSPGECRVVRLAALGLRNAEVARRLCVSEGTVKTHLNNAFRKLDLRNRVQLTLYAVSSGLVWPGEAAAPRRKIHLSP